MPHHFDVDLVTQAYIECMLWADRPEETINCANEASDQLKAQAREDVEDFISLLARNKVDTTGWNDIALGHDFWLTRQHHGTGFWDRGLPAGEELTRWAHTYSSKCVYVGDDGKFYCE